MKHQQYGAQDLFEPISLIGSSHISRGQLARILRKYRKRGYTVYRTLDHKGYCIKFMFNRLTFYPL